MRPATQNQRVLTELRRGPVNTTDFHAPTCDGGKPILRLAARIRDLQDEGYSIASARRLNGTATYTLVRDVERSVDTPEQPCPRSELGMAPAVVGGSLDTALFDAKEFLDIPTFRDAA